MGWDGIDISVFGVVDGGFSEEAGWEKDVGRGVFEIGM